MDHLLLTPDEAAQLLRVEASDVHRLLERGDLAGLQVAGHWRIPAEALREFVAAGVKDHNLKTLEAAFNDASRWATLIAENEELVQQLEAKTYPEGSMGAFLQQALAISRQQSEGKVVPFKPRTNEHKP